MPKSTGSMNSLLDSHWHSLESMPSFLFFFFLKQDPFFEKKKKCGITNKGERIPPASLKHDFPFVLLVQFTCLYADSLLESFVLFVRLKWLTRVVAAPWP